MNKDLTSRNEPSPASSPNATPTATLHALEPQVPDLTHVPPSSTDWSSDLRLVQPELGLTPDPVYAITDHVRLEAQELINPNFQEQTESRHRLISASAQPGLI
ncbi:Aste57867_3441 [Aphanomyces stellatus]|uniref:Aste57867_3441 protein n=1 Tax=Aphanomyces stellatus TaxID=120398 RepID=A0A485KAR6_9STRA|nr:hypothetical protein As57867_003431 [Aphanomyces stellatus]VFT80607.1 Aste57867_3441 [Aphanomyces stellatus]